ncbi:hypothetical protein EYF80_021017 [Liparis tanakae]|uniref:Uncharacterized protein n=1 Tax=Liparis tanakae TaxID=230148 RepID=A0A4Z2HSQ5_9TELE|nr:hypothetical protein EYF80_021017 [Liparis tanakae]
MSMELNIVSRSSSSMSDISVSLSKWWPPSTPSCCERHSCSPSDLAWGRNTKWSWRRSLDSVRSRSTVSERRLLCSSFIFSLCRAWRD